MSDQNNNEKKQIVTRESNLGDIIFRYPKAAEIFTDYGLHCVGCIASGFDTVGSGSKIHGMEEEEVDEMIARVNEVIEHEE